MVCSCCYGLFGTRFFCFAVISLFSIYADQRLNQRIIPHIMDQIIIYNLIYVRVLFSRFFVCSSVPISCSENFHSLSNCSLIPMASFRFHHLFGWFVSTMQVFWFIGAMQFSGLPPWYTSLFYMRKLQVILHEAVNCWKQLNLVMVPLY